jgi:hypothetical protein
MHRTRSLVTVASQLLVTGLIGIAGTAGTAHAQSPYVGVSALADIARFGTAGLGASSGGEAFGAAVRVGTSVTDRWGVDLEFTRPGEIEEPNAFGIPVPLPLLGEVAGTAVAARPGGGSNAAAGLADRIGSIFPVPAQLTTTYRFTTLSVMPWVRQSLGSRADIVYLGGIAFLRTASSVDYDGVIILGRSGGRLQEYVTYGTAAVVGLDVRVSMTDRVRLVPGVRLLATDEAGPRGWITRPAIGLQWAF